MRHWLLVFIIALLPLRGWVGDAMATGMASSPAAYHQQQAGHAHNPGTPVHGSHEDAHATPVATHTDCPGHLATGSTAGNDHCDSCSVCQACHTVALSPPAPAWATLPTPPELPHSPVALFASADVAQGKKPPIS